MKKINGYSNMINILLVGDTAGKKRAVLQMEKSEIKSVRGGVHIDEISLDSVNELISQDLPHQYNIVLLAPTKMDEKWSNALRSLRMRWDYKSLPVIVVSSDLDREMQAISDGANGFVDYTDDYIKSRYFKNLVTALTSAYNES